jgi:hypothetical protein
MNPTREKLHDRDVGFPQPSLDNCRPAAFAGAIRQRKSRHEFFLKNAAAGIVIKKRFGVAIACEFQRARR